MKAIILAAGEGKRLQPLTNEQPKSMVNLFGTTLLERQISVLRKSGIDDIIVVTGYKSELINIPGLKYRKNKNFANTNMVETLFCAKDDLDGDIIVSYADIIYETRILKKLLDSKHDISITVDLNWKQYWEKRFSNPLSDAESLKINSEGHIIEIGQKVTDINEIKGQYIGLMKFNTNGTKIIRDFYEECKVKSQNNINPLNQEIDFEKSYMTDLLQGLIDNSYKLNPIFVNGGWIELDSINDYNLYKKLFEQNELNHLINLSE